MSTLKLTDDQCDDIVIISENNPYKNGQRAKDNKTFNTYRYDGTVFTVESSNPFNKCFADGKLATVKFIEGTRDVTTVDADGNESIAQVRNLEFDAHTSMTQQMNRATHGFNMNRLRSMESVPVTEDFLNSLQNS